MRKIWCLILLLSLTGACAQRPSATRTDRLKAVQTEETVQSVEAAQELSEAEKALGVRVETVRLAAAGYMLDFRYYVYDSEKSRPLASKKFFPYLIHQRTGAYLGIPAPAKVGSLRQKPRSHYPDRSYFMLFANPGGLVKRGDRVTIVVGKYRFENLVVQ
ncbi:hypothetical protein EDC39_11356 [Geothermobacter ehrlichii]|uniref:Uncharacterized protein n=1 Tax=Geothermobacter ehrlichii TaxID=213224 RepID=A0A5D3WFM2_9BACT|nr:hypothetical protein [Geothermobacter ehrlichii]TYO96666.1 hypothetical protein EDC39_11356 [Geothermobacter ehrlichii]